MLGSVDFPQAAAVEPSETKVRSESFSFRLDTPAITFAPGPDGATDVTIEGFGTATQRPGAPQLPTHTFLIAIPPGVEPRLEFRVLGEEFRKGVLPSPAPVVVGEPTAAQQLELERADGDPARRLEILRNSTRTVRKASPSVYRGTQRYPEQPVWLGSTGVLRDQRFVEVHLAPVAFDPSLPGLTVQRSLEVTVHFDRPGGETSPPLATNEARVEPLFESVYRRAILNYAQGRTFRRSRFVRPGAPTSTASGRGTAPIVRLKVNQDGLLRLGPGQIAGTGLETQDVATWRLTNRGVTIPLQIQDDGDGLLGPGEWVQFLAQALTDEAPAVLDTVIDLEEDVFAANDFTDENVYFLTVDLAPVAAMPTRDAAPTFVRIPPASFTATTRAEVDNAFRPLRDDDDWYWLPTLFSGGQTTSRTEPVLLEALASTTAPLELRVKVRGVSDDIAASPDHLTEVRLENDDNPRQLLASVPGSFDGRNAYRHDLSWIHTGGPQATDTLHVSLEVFTGAFTRNDVILDSIEIDYQRSFEALGDELVFQWPDGDAEFVIDGLLGAGAEVYEVSAAPGTRSVAAPTRLTGVAESGIGPFSLRFRVDEDPAVPDGTPRTFHVVGPGAVRTPDPAHISSDGISDLRLNSNQADLVVIARPSVLDNGPGSPLSQLLTHHASAAGGNLTSKVVLIGDVEDEFNHGLPGPTAIREFLRYVLSDAPGEGWADPKPTLVMLLGDGSFDYKGILVSGGNVIPTQILYRNRPELGYYASDNHMTAVVGNDLLPDLLVGRLPVRNRGEANQILSKILAYETTAHSGPWVTHSLFISDRGKLDQNPGEALDFEALNAAAAVRAPAGYTTREIQYFTQYFNNPGVLNPAAEMSTAIKDAVNGIDAVSDGAVIVQFIGHGSFQVWSDDAYFDERDPFNLDTGDLTNGPQAPWVVVHNCLSGGFHAPQPFTMGEDWLQRIGGGAVGFLSPSGLSANFISDFVSDILWDDVYGGRKERLVAALTLDILVGLCTSGRVESCQNYILLGDPAMRLAMYSVEPATQLQATPGDGQVQLSWIASPAPGATYDVYRRRDISSGAYSRLNGTPVAATSFLDTAAVNTFGYVYYVVAVDTAGFESRFSNFNSDCDVDGPDCVKAIPLNPNPPIAPVGLSISDPGVGDRLLVSWQLNPESDIDVYTVHFGTESGVYTSIKIVGATSSSTILAGLVEAQPYFVAVSATNTSGTISALSAEMTDYPVTGFGLRPPDYIDDLAVSIFGTDVRLEWSEVTTNVYGKPVNLNLYEILRGTDVDFSNAGLSVVGTCPAPCASWDDPGAAAGGPSFHYRVRAVDQEGLEGGLGAQYPAPTTLTVARSQLVPGNLALDWQPVLLTVDGTPAEGIRYALYATVQPLSLADVVSGAVQPLIVVDEPGIDLPPPLTNQYYSVFAVDSRGNMSLF